MKDGSYRNVNDINPSKFFLGKVHVIRVNVNAMRIHSLINRASMLLSFR